MRFALLLFLLISIPVKAEKPGDVGTAEYRTAAELVKRLGDPQFKTRESAAKQLTEMGGAAIPALAEGTQSSDAEIRSRSATLLPQAQAIEWKRRADAFLKSPDDKRDRDLPLLAEWEKLAGKLDAGSRQLFADMLKTNGPLLDLASLDPSVGASALAERSMHLLDSARVKGKQIEAPAAYIAAVLFVQAVLKDEPKAHAISDRSKPHYLLANPAVAKAMADKEVGSIYRRLVVRWAKSQPATESMSSLYFALLAHRHPFEEADAHLIRIVTLSKNTQIRWVAMEALGRSGSKAARGKLTELLADSTAMYENLGDPAGHEVRDCALAALIHAEGKKSSDYGLKTYMTANFWAGGEADTITMDLCGFATGGDREAGIKKWKGESAKK